MKELSECKNWFKELYMNVLDAGGFYEVDMYTNRDITRYNMFITALEFIYGTEFNKVRSEWIKEAIEEYYKWRSNK